MVLVLVLTREEDDRMGRTKDENVTSRHREREALDKETQLKTHKHDGHIDNLKNK